VTSPAVAAWRTAATAAHRALGQDDAADALAAEQLALARKGGAEITQATVETHLRHAFRKLGITSRADLSAALDAASSPPQMLPTQ
jgi:hypothetical protein